MLPFAWKKVLLIAAVARAGFFSARGPLTYRFNAPFTVTPFPVQAAVAAAPIWLPVVVHRPYRLPTAVPGPKSPALSAIVVWSIAVPVTASLNTMVNFGFSPAT